MPIAVKIAAYLAEGIAVAKGEWLHYAETATILPGESTPKTIP